MKRSFLAVLLLTLLLAACKPGAVPTVATVPPKPSVTQPGITHTAYPAPETAKPSLPPTTLLARSEPTDTPPTQPITPTETLAPTGWSGPLPVLTADNQGLTFGPGQLIAALAEGFTPGETVAIALIHDQQGVVYNKTARPGRQPGAPAHRAPLEAQRR